MLWYSLEVPHWGASNEYPQHMFSWRNKKNWHLDTPRVWSSASLVIRMGLTCDSTACDLKHMTYHVVCITWPTMWPEHVHKLPIKYSLEHGLQIYRMDNEKPGEGESGTFIHVPSYVLDSEIFGYLSIFNSENGQVCASLWSGRS